MIRATPTSARLPLRPASAGAEAGSDGIVQITVGGARYLSGRRDGLAGARAFAALGHELADGLAGRGGAAHRPLPARARRRVPAAVAGGVGRPGRARRAGAVSLAHVRRLDAAAGGEPALSAELLEQCRALDIVLEIECGVVGGEEDGIGGEDVTASGCTRRRRTCCAWRRCSAPASAGATCWRRRSATSTACMRRVASSCARRSSREARHALARAHPGARFQYVFHGSSGSSRGGAAGGGRSRRRQGQPRLGGAVRVHARRGRAHVRPLRRRPAVDGGVGDKRAYDPRAWGAEAEAGMAARVAQACEVLGSAGRSITA